MTANKNTDVQRKMIGSVTSAKVSHVQYVKPVLNRGNHHTVNLTNINFLRSHNHLTRNNATNNGHTSLTLIVDRKLFDPTFSGKTLFAQAKNKFFLQKKLDKKSIWKSRTVLYHFIYFAYYCLPIILLI